jgi:hypothetical protein
MVTGGPDTMLKTVVAAAAILCSAFATGPASADEKDKPNAVERTATRAGKFTEKTATRAAKFTEKTATRAGKFVERTATKTDKAIRRAVE